MLKASNRIDIETFLNPLNESCTMDEATDEEIMQAVMETRKEDDDDGGDQDSDDNAETPDTPPRG